MKRSRMRMKGRPGNSARRSGLSTWILLSTLLLVTMLFAIPSLAQGANDGETMSTVLSPSIVVSPTGEVSTGMAIGFDASTSVHSVPPELVDEVRYLWNLGDGTVQIGERITHQYATSGMFSVSLTMEVFEQSGVFYRGTETTEVTVAVAEFPRFVAVINLATGLTQPGSYAVLIQIEDQYLLIGQEDGPASLPVELPRTPSHLASDLMRFVLSGGLLSVGELRLWDAMLAMDLAADGWLGFVGFGTSISEATLSLTELYPVVEQAGYELIGVINRANLVTLGACYEITPNLYLLGALGSLYVAGTYEGSSRLILDGDLLPVPFESRMMTLSFGVGLRIGWLMFSLQALMTL